MNKELIDNNHIVLKNLISQDVAFKLAEEFIEFDKQWNYPTDDILKRVMKSDKNTAASLYNPIGAVELLCELTPKITSIVEETVVPSYSFGRIYRNGDFLPTHTDRAACEISLTLHLKGDHSWNFEIETPQQEVVAYELEPGDAVLYLGPSAPHSRATKFEGTYYTQFFLHYVRSRGLYANAVFDSMVVKKDDEQLKQEYQELYGI